MEIKTARRQPGVSSKEIKKEKNMIKSDNDRKIIAIIIHYYYHGNKYVEYIKEDLKILKNINRIREWT